MKAKMMLMTLMAMMMASCHEFKASVDVKGPTATYNRPNVKGFEAVEIVGSMSVVYQQAKDYKVSVTAPRDLLDRIETTVDNGTLRVEMKSVNFFFDSFNSDDIVVHVSSPDLVKVYVKGSGDFTCNDLIDTDNMSIELRGSGDVDIKHLVCDRLQVNLMGSGDIELPHVTSIRSEVSLVGSGDVEIGQFDVEHTNIALKGSGEVKMVFNNCGTIDSEVVGSGDIVLEGNAKQESHRVKGSGDIDTSRLTLR